MEIIAENENKKTDPDYITIYKNDIEANLQMYFEDMGTDAESITDLKQSQFSYLLDCVGSELFNNNELKQNRNDNDFTSSYYYNFDKLETVYNIYIKLCSKYNKIVSLYDYALLIHADYNSIHNWKYEKTNTPHYALFRKIATARENGLKNRCLDSSNILGTITIGNTESGWNQGAGSVQHITNNIITADALPILKTTQKNILTKNE